MWKLPKLINAKSTDMQPEVCPIYAGAEPEEAAELQPESAKIRL